MLPIFPLRKTHFLESEDMTLLKQQYLLIKGMIHGSFVNLRSIMASIPGFRNAHTQQKGKTPIGLICTAMTKKRQNTALSLSGQMHGRSLQLGEGWHSSRHTVHFWNPLVLFQKETDARCYASATAYAMMIPPCNACSARLKRPTHSQH